MSVDEYYEFRPFLRRTAAGTQGKLHVVQHSTSVCLAKIPSSSTESTAETVGYLISFPDRKYYDLFHKLLDEYQQLNKSHE